MKNKDVYIVEILKGIGGSSRTYIFLDVFSNENDANLAGKTACLPIKDGGRGAFVYRILKTKLK